MVAIPSATVIPTIKPIETSTIHIDVIRDLKRINGHLTSVAQEVQSAGFTHVALLGMGGSSLAPEVLSRTFGRAKGFPEFHMLDSTDPAQVKALESKLNLKSTLFIVSSKSGSTLEPAGATDSELRQAARAWREGATPRQVR